MSLKTVLAAFAMMLGYAAFWGSGFSSVAASDQSQVYPTQRNTQSSSAQQTRAPYRAQYPTQHRTLDPVIREIITRQYADFLLIDKSDRMLVAYSKGKPIRTYRGLRFGDAPRGHKRFEGDERTPEGLYTIDTRNPRSSYHLSLRISYPNARDRDFAARSGRSAGGNIFIHGQPNGYRGKSIKRDWTDGCIALTNAQIEELWTLVPDGTPIRIQP